MSSNLRQPSRIAAYTAEGSYYPRELVEVNGELYLINSDGTRTRVNPAEITVLTDADGNELASIDPTVADTIELPEGTSSQSGLLKFGTTAPKANGTAAVGSASTVSRSDHVHPAQTISRTYTASIGTTWTGSAAPYTQTISVSGVTATDNPIVDVVLSGTYATDEASLVEYAKIYRITTAANSITVYASEKTESTVSIQLKCVN